MIEGKLSKLDDMSRSMDRIVYDVDNHKTNFFPPKLDINESIEALRVCMD